MKHSFRIHLIRMSSLIFRGRCFKKCIKWFCFVFINVSNITNNIFAQGMRDARSKSTDNGFGYDDSRSHDSDRRTSQSRTWPVVERFSVLVVR